MRRNRLQPTELSEPLGRNIVRLARERGLTLEKLALLADVDKGNFSRMIKDGTGYSSKSLDRIAAGLGVTLGALFADDDGMAQLPGGLRRVPLRDNVHAGAFTRVERPFQDAEMTEYIVTSMPVSSRAFAMRVEGDSMMPDFLPGSIVIVDPDILPKPRNYVVAVDANGDAQLKVYAPRGINSSGQEVFALVPANTFYPTLRSDEQELHIVGVVREHRSPDPKAPIK